MSTWRQRAQRVIAAVVVENPDADEKTLRKRLSDAYPFTERDMYPYRVWCEEVRDTLRRRFPIPEPEELEVVP